MKEVKVSIYCDGKKTSEDSFENVAYAIGHIARLLGYDSVNRDASHKWYYKMEVIY